MSFLSKAHEFLRLIDLGQSEIRRETRHVFLCGGRLVDESPVASSARHALLRYLPSRHLLGTAKIVLAETANNALPKTNFSNLLDLEEYISAFSDAVILFVESAGSICELGAFVKTPEIRQKLIVVVSNEHDNVNSFIKLGAIQYYIDSFGQGQKINPEVHPFTWNYISGGVGVPDYVLPAIESDISQAVDRVRPRGKFRNTLGDNIYLALAFCHILRGAKLGEIKDCFSELGLETPEKTVIKYLSVLEIVGLISPVSIGQKHKYYVPKIESLPMKIAFKQEVEDKNKNTMRRISDIVDLIRDEEPNRLRVFGEYSSAA